MIPKHLTDFVAGYTCYDKDEVLNLSDFGIKFKSNKYSRKLEKLIWKVLKILFYIYMLAIVYCGLLWLIAQ